MSKFSPGDRLTMVKSKGYANIANGEQVIVVSAFRDEGEDMIVVRRPDESKTVGPFYAWRFQRLGPVDYSTVDEGGVV